MTTPTFPPKFFSALKPQRLLGFFSRSHPQQRSLRACSCLPRLHAAPVVILACLVLSASVFTPLWQAADARLMDAVWRNTPASERRAQVVLIELPYAGSAGAQEPAFSAQLQALGRQWLQQGALAVGYGFALPTAGPHSRLVCSSSGQLEVAQRAPYWQALLTAAQKNIPEGSTDYAYRAAHLPRLSLQRVLNEGLPPQVLQQQVILFGYAHDPALRTIPVPGQAQAISPLEYDGLQVDAMLQQGMIWHLPPAPSALLLLVCALLWWLLLLRSSPKAGLAWLVVLLPGLGLAAAAMLLWAKIWLPLPALAAQTLLLALAVAYARAHAEEEQMRSLIRSASAKLHKLALPPAIIETAEHWQFLLRLLDQTMHLQRVILLEVQANRTHLQEVDALGCALGTISEARRDYRRAPYAQAIARQGLYEVKDYLHSAAADERQFILPLLAQGRLQGFLAFGVAQQQCAHFLASGSSLQAIAKQIAGLLAQRHQWLREQALAQQAWRVWLQQANSTSTAVLELQQALQQIEQRAQILEQSLQQAAHATILFDVFGRVLSMNQAMRSHLHSAGITPDGEGASGLLAQLSGKGRDEVRLAMQNLILQRQEVIWPLAGMHAQRVLRAQALHSAGGEQNLPFALVGIQLDLLDVSELVLQQDAGAEIRRQVLQHLHADVQKMPSLLRAYAKLPADSAAARRVLQVLQQRADNMARVVDKSQLLLSSLSAHSLSYPLPLRPQVEQALASCAATLQRKHIQPRLDFAPGVSHGFALPQPLQDCLLVLFQALIADAMDDSVLQLSAISSAGNLNLVCSNQGYGSSNQRLQQGMEGTDPAFAALRQVRSRLQAWGGDLEIEVKPGQGMRARLSLQAFCWLEEDDNGAPAPAPVLTPLAQPCHVQNAFKISA